MKISKIKDWLFKFRYGFRGFPRKIHNYEFRLDESLRRWDLSGENEVQDALEHHLKKGDVLLDIGANFGMHSLFGAKIVGGEGVVIAVEPVPFNLKLLKRNISLNDMEDIIQVHPVALVSEGQEDIKMAIDDGLSVAASLEVREGSKYIKVASDTVDELIGKAGIIPSLIKIDVEGAEHEVLKGARSTLEKYHPILIIEIHDFALPAFGSSSEDLSEYLSEYGYKKEIIDRVHGSMGDYHHALFMHATRD